MPLSFGKLARDPPGAIPQRDFENHRQYGVSAIGKKR